MLFQTRSHKLAMIFCFSKSIRDLYFSGLVLKYKKFFRAVFFILQVCGWKLIQNAHIPAANETLDLDSLKWTFLMNTNLCSKTFIAKPLVAMEFSRGNLLHTVIKETLNNSLFRGVFRTLSNNYDKVFLRK